jgi:hypothetical protein
MLERLSASSASLRETVLDFLLENVPNDFPPLCGKRNAHSDDGFFSLTAPSFGRFA